MATFTTPGGVFGFMTKLQNHIKVGNEYRVKDYLCAAFETEDPSQYDDHPCRDVIKEATEFLESHGWKVGITTWKQLGTQFVCQSPNNEWYHSEYDHGED